MVDVALFFVGILIILFFVAFLMVVFGRKKEFVEVGDQVNLVPVFYVPRWWFFWPPGRSMTLWLPLVGKFVAIYSQDARTELSKKLTLTHEYVHYERIGKRPLVWFLKYVFFPKFRFWEEVYAFRATINFRRNRGIFTMIFDGTEFGIVDVAASEISKYYFLPRKYNYIYCYNALLKGDDE